MNHFFPNRHPLNPQGWIGASIRRWALLIGITLLLQVGCAKSPPPPYPTPPSPQTNPAQSNPARTNPGAAAASQTPRDTAETATESGAMNPGSSHQDSAHTAEAQPGPRAAASRGQPPSPGTDEQPASGGSANPSPATAGGGAASQTGEERRSRLEQAFAESLAAFDGRMARERELLAQSRANKAAAANAIEATDAWGAPTQESSESASPSSASGAGGVPDIPPERSQQASRDERTVPPTPPPADIPNGQDDDIVARQIREAAENETDPELRAKLWEEYKRYKQSGA